MASHFNEPLFVISVAARLVEMHPQTLRKYEREGLIAPSRTQGNLRLYSDRDIEQLRQVKYLVEDRGLNLAGVQLALELTRRLREMRAFAADAATASTAPSDGRRRIRRTQGGAGSRAPAARLHRRGSGRQGAARDRQAIRPFARATRMNIVITPGRDRRDCTMATNQRFTEKAQEAILAAQRRHRSAALAARAGGAAARRCSSRADGIVPQVLLKARVDPPELDCRGRRRTVERAAEAAVQRRGGGLHATRKAAREGRERGAASSATSTSAPSTCCSASLERAGSPAEQLLTRHGLTRDEAQGR